MKKKPTKSVKRTTVFGLPAKWTRVEIYSRKLKRNVRHDKLVLLVAGNNGLIGEEIDDCRNKFSFICNKQVGGSFNFGAGSYDICWKMAEAAFRAWVKEVVSSVRDKVNTI